MAMNSKQQQLSEAVQTVFHASLFAVFIWCYSVFLIFQILHSPDHASTVFWPHPEIQFLVKSQQ